MELLNQEKIFNFHTKHKAQFSIVTCNMIMGFHQTCFQFSFQPLPEDCVQFFNLNELLLDMQ